MALLLRNGHSSDKNNAPFSRFKAILQEVVWIIDNWEESILDYELQVDLKEVKEAEILLTDLKKKLWKLWTTVFIKMNGSRRSGVEPVEWRPQQNVGSSSNRKLITSGIIARSNPLPKHPQYVLMDWCTILDERNRLCLQGKLPDEGDWVTTPIVKRIEPFLVETSSRTVYRMLGEIVVPEDEPIPAFVERKFRYGFPIDWELVAKKWVSLRKEGFSQNQFFDHAHILSLKPQVLLEDIRKRPFSQRSMNNRRMMKSNSVGCVAEQDSVEPVKKNTPMQERTSLHKDKKVGVTNSGNNSNHTLSRRYSKRLHEKSLHQLSFSDGLNQNIPEKVIDAVHEAKLLKMWTATYSNEKNGLLLTGVLISENGEVIARNHTSSRVCERLESDLIKTEGGCIYRLIGSSACVLSDNKLFDSGFPANWKEHISKYQESANKNVTVNVISSNKRDILKEQHPNATSNSTLSVSQKSRNQSLKIQQLIKHSIYKNQSLASEKNKNGDSMNKRANLTASKRETERHLEISSQTLSTKRRRASTTEQAGPSDDVMNQSMLNNSEASEFEWKNGCIKTIQKSKTKASDSRIVASMMDEEQAEHGIISTPADEEPNNVKKENGARSKYVLGLITDDCDTDSDFNIFS